MEPSRPLFRFLQNKDDEPGLKVRLCLWKEWYKVGENIDRGGGLVIMMYVGGRDLAGTPGGLHRSSPPPWVCRESLSASRPIPSALHGQP